MFRRSGRGRLLLLVFLALSIILITLDFRPGYNGVFERAKDVGVTIVAPVQRGITAVFRPVRNFFSSVAELGSLRSKNDDLEAEVAQLQSEIAQAKALIEENQSLREIQALRESYTSMESVAAEVIAKAPGNYKWAVVIDKGLDDGVRPDMAVLNQKGLVGKIITADDHQSTVLLIIDPRGAAAARVEDRRDTGRINGNGAGENLSLQLIGPNAEVQDGDRVVTAGYDGSIFPPRIPIGVVTRVSGDERVLERDIEVDPFVDFTALDFVVVLLESGPQEEV